MKHKKLHRLIICCFTLILAFSASIYARPSKAKVRANYKDYIANNIQAPNGGKAIYLDMNRDSINEMLYIYYREAGAFYPTCEIYTFRNGKVIKAGEQGGILNVRYSRKDRKICTVVRGAFSAWHIVYKLKRGKVVQTAAYFPGMYGMPGNKAMNFQKEISEAQYDRAIKRLEKWKLIYGF